MPAATYTGSSKRYFAFISYSHADREWAQWLHRSLEAFAIPSRLHSVEGPHGPVGKTLAPVFIDRAELASSADLSESVRAALDNSAHLIVVCSPRAAASRWVNEEIRIFKQSGRAGRIFCLLVGGQPGQDVAAENSCYPPALRFELAPDGTPTPVFAATPLGADVRPGHDARSDALLKLIAGMLRVPFDELRRRAQQRRQRMLATFGTVAASIAAIIGYTTYRSVQEREAAVAARQAQQVEAEGRRRMIDVLKNQLQLANPDHELKGAVLSRQVLDELIEANMRAVDDKHPLDPSIAMTIAEVYTGLGLFSEGKRWSGSAGSKFQSELGAPLTDRIAAATVLGEVLLARGEYAEATKSLRTAVKLAAESPLRESSAHTRALADLGDALIETDGLDEADTILKTALDIDTRLHGKQHFDVARDISLQATSSFYRGELDRAEQLFTESLTIRRATLPAGNVKIAEDLNALGSIYFTRQDHARAESMFAEALRTYRSFYGDNHPETAVLMHNLGRTKLERGAFRESIQLTQQGIHASEAERVVNHEGLSFGYDSLGLAQMGIGDYTNAEKAFAHALEIAKLHKHRMQGPILIDFADLMCRTQRFAEGLQHLEAARPLLARDYAAQPWRSAMADSVEGACRLGLKDKLAGRKLVSSGYRNLLATIGPKRLFTRDAAERARL